MPASTEDPLDAAAGIVDPGLRSLLLDHWSWTMARSPEWASNLGDHRGDSALSHRSVAAAEEGTAARRVFLERARELATHEQAPRDRMFLDVFVGAVQSQVDTAVCHEEQWSFSPRMNPMADLFSTVQDQRLDTGADTASLTTRLSAFASVLKEHEDALRQGLASGWVVNRTSAERTLAMVEEQLAKPTADWSIAAIGPKLGGAWKTRLQVALDASVRPPLVAYAAFLRDEILPASRSDEHPGLASLSGLDGCYSALVRSFVTRDVSPESLHQLGLDQMAKVHAEMMALGERALGTRDVPEILAHLRSDPALRFANAAQIEAAATTALRKAEAAVPAVFGHLPKTPCGVSVIPEYAAPYTTIAYYQQPTGDNQQGQYFVNTYNPTSRARFEAEVLAFHESVPGHHLQIALSYELPAVPAFHRYEGATAFVEGWGLYSERLADDLGLYTSDLSRLGMLSFDAWRAARLVVDTGLHANGWSRAQAEAYLRDNTALAEQNVVNEVDRYITWPGQALAYKTGQLEILALRAEARARLSDRFDLAAFHDVVLGEGALPMDVLRARVERWIAESGG